MGLNITISDDMKAALRAGDAVKLSTLRMLVAAIRNREIEKNIKELDDAEVIQILQRQIKQHKDSIEQFQKGNRPDLAEKEAKELKVLEAYMPAQMGQDELTALIKAVIAETGAASKADGGKVMKAVMDKVKGKADGKTVSQTVMGLLK
jgi:uncharacterized protein